MLRDVETMNYADIEKAINDLGLKVNTHTHTHMHTHMHTHTHTRFHTYMCMGTYMRTHSFGLLCAS